MNIEVDCLKKVIDDLIEAVIWTKFEIRIIFCLMLVVIAIVYLIS